MCTSEICRRPAEPWKAHSNLLQIYTVLPPKFRVFDWGWWQGCPRPGISPRPWVQTSMYFEIVIECNCPYEVRGGCLVRDLVWLHHCLDRWLDYLTFHHHETTRTEKLFIVAWKDYVRLSCRVARKIQSRESIKAALHLEIKWLLSRSTDETKHKGLTRSCNSSHHHLCIEWIKTRRCYYYPETNSENFDTSRLQVPEHRMYHSIRVFGIVTGYI